MIELKTKIVLVAKDPVSFSNPGHTVLNANPKNPYSQVGMVVRFRKEDIFEEIPEGLLILEENIYAREIPDNHDQGTRPSNEKGT